MDAAAQARRARAVEELRRLSALADESDETPAERLSTVPESDGTPAEQECDHFSMRYSFSIPSVDVCISSLASIQRCISI
jgi:hypothetical protein